ncbi:MAG: putative 4-hydroxybenzoate polyprenyltransferase [Planctomycetes bacterium]|nr:putative 4-hydroxybenzoate polyprenyltransferase [Planctomycetota bacterium]
MTGALSAIRMWAEMVRFSHSIFALPFALMAAFLAGRNIVGRGWPYWGQLGLIVVCMIAARSVAMTFNRIVDAEIDARNPRTMHRPLPAGRMTKALAWSMLTLFAVTFGIGCLSFHVFYGNAWPMLLSGPVLLYVCGYSFAKRFTRWSHYYLGSAIALSPGAAWVAIHPGSLGFPAWLLMGIVTCWIAGFDIIYACQDIAVDQRDGLHSLPADLGPVRALWIARLSHVLVVAGLIWLATVANLGAVYAVGVLAVAVLLVVEHALVRAGDYRKVNLAFFTINGLVSIVLATAVIVDVLLAVPDTTL